MKKRILIGAVALIATCLLAQAVFSADTYFQELDNSLKVSPLGINNHEKAAIFERIYNNYVHNPDFIRRFFNYIKDDEDKYYWLGIYLFDNSYTSIANYDLALATLNLGLKSCQGADEVRFYFIIGCLYWRLDQKDLGRPYFEKAYELAKKYPGNIPALSLEERKAIDDYYGF